MPRVCIASANPVKTAAIRGAFLAVFPSEQFEFFSVDVPSGVSDQPMGDEETLLGARNRVRNARAACPDADYHCGLEGGCAFIGEDMHCFAWIVISNNEAKPVEGKARTCTFDTPPLMSALVAGGMELGHANDKVFSLRNSKQQGGAVGSLTGGLITRQTYYEPAAILALIPFRNRDLFSLTSFPEDTAASQ
eukprot:m.62306 g.62306  ORF g.62306 m.62306 type:complete len:192 (-) comp12395_c0_seq1:82-657(-)